MTHQSQHSKTMLITDFSAKFIVSILIFVSSFLLLTDLSHAKSSDKTPVATQLLEDPTFLSKLEEKITPRIDHHAIQKIIREYLLSHPEILIEMQLALQEKIEKQNEKKSQEQALILNLFKKEIFHSPYDAVLGNPNGKKVLVDFFDYNCGYCKTSYPYIENLIKKYPDLRVIIKDLPILGHDSIAAHTVAYAFRKQFPKKYPQFHETLLTSEGRANEAKAIKIAVSLGADEKKLRDMIKDPNLQNSFERNIQIASQLNITGTPAYIIKDKVFVGAAKQDILEEALENME
ncbi:DsbA family protein [Bartonella rattaustraliani]|uniref:DsbA family protein n=1 Tax=Bartonella rattaustraliani TaxID=481139 RepID=UPI00036630BB|nr:DsbA family protein [Bartonella rattaustraliani]